MNKRRLKDNIKFTLVMGFVFSLTWFLVLWPGLAALNSSPILFFARMLIIFTWLAGITYKALWYKSNSGKFRTILLFLFFIFICIPIVQSIDAVYNITLIYQALKKPSNGWKGRVHQSDNRLGIKPVPNSTGLQLLSIGDGIPLKYDENGFRVPLSYNHDINKNSHPRILFLGCSFTYGGACLAEETFPFLVEKELNGYSINAGVSSYGLSQMYLLAQELIPKYKPDFVVFQHSPWLVSRSLTGNIPANLNYDIPAPYFDKDNKIVLPLFQSVTFKFPSEHYKLAKKSFADYLSFMAQTYPLYMIDVCKKSIVKMKQLLHLVPKPSKNAGEVERYVISEVNKICKQNNSKMIVLNLSWLTKNGYRPNFPLDKNEILLVANADSSINANLGPGEKYEKKYYHYRMVGKDSVMVDDHPNPAAEKIIADEIIRVIRKNGMME